jgi:histidine triad (HIT) family protein
MPEGKCIFCGIAACQAPAYIVAEDDLSLALLDINPLSEGHCLVISRRHVPWWHDLTKPETDSLFQMAKEVAGKIMEAYHSDFVCMYARGRRIPHTHLFLVPTYGDDPLDRFFNALEGFQEAPSEWHALKQPDRLRATAERLRKSGSSGWVEKIKG